MTLHRIDAASAQPLASIIVLFLPGSTAVQRCVRSVIENVSADMPTELLLLQNGGTQLEPLDVPETANIFYSVQNLGFGGGCNWLSSKARGAYLVFLNDDAAVGKDWLSPLISAAERDGTVASAGSVLVGPSRRIEEAGRVLWRDGVSSGIGRGVDRVRASWPEVMEVDHCSACSLLVRRTAFESVGGFDERYFPAYYEDTDIALRFRLSGWRNVCVTRSVVEHERSASTNELWRRFLGLRNHRQFVAKWERQLSLFPPRPRDEPSPREVQRAAAGVRARSDALYHQRPTDGSSVGMTVTKESATRESEDPALLKLELQHAMEELRLKDEYIASLQRSLPELERALRHIVSRERRRARRRDLFRRIPLAREVVAAARRLSRRRGE